MTHRRIALVASLVLLPMTALAATASSGTCGSLCSTVGALFGCGC